MIYIISYTMEDLSDVHDVYDYILKYTSATHHGVAKIMHYAFKNEYRMHIIGRKHTWFSVDAENHLSPIDDIIIKRRISLDIADMVMEARNRFKRDPEYNKMEALATNNKSLEALTMTLNQLVQKRIACREINKIDEAREVDLEIRHLEGDIEQISKRQELMRADVKDKKFAELTDLEMKLYNNGFKDGVIKVLGELFYAPIN